MALSFYCSDYALPQMWIPREYKTWTFLIFWRANRPKSYISRTKGWEDFPQGRWGDSRSASYGALSDHQVLHVICNCITLSGFHSKWVLKGFHRLVLLTCSRLLNVTSSYELLCWTKCFCCQFSRPRARDKKLQQEWVVPLKSVEDIQEVEHFFHYHT